MLNINGSHLTGPVTEGITFEYLIAQNSGLLSRFVELLGI